MSKKDMQFADPDWQPPGQRKSAPEQEPFHPQPVDAPRDERPGWQSPPQGESDAESEYYAGYRARQQRSYSVRSVISVLVVLLCVAFSIGTAGWFLTHQAPTPKPPKSPDPTLVTNLQDPTLVTMSGTCYNGQVYKGGLSFQKGTRQSWQPRSGSV